MTKDPVCNMEVDETTAKYVSEYKGKNYFFCAPGCKAMFDRDPAKFV
jgi:YHS domain-containing protein